MKYAVLALALIGCATIHDPQYDGGVLPEGLGSSGCTPSRASGPITGATTFRAPADPLGGESLQMSERAIRSPRGALFGSPLRVSVSDVIKLGADKEVGGIYAGWIVATVADDHAAWDGTVGQFPRDTMGLLGATPNGNMAVSAPAAASRQPQPAFIRAATVNLLPKSLGQRPPFHGHNLTPSAPVRKSLNTEASTACLRIHVENHRTHDAIDPRFILTGTGRHDLGPVSGMGGRLDRMIPIEWLDADRCAVISVHYPGGPDLVYEETCWRSGEHLDVRLDDIFVSGAAWSHR